MTNLQFLTYRQWQRRPLRAIFTILSVAIAVAAMLGTSVAQTTVRAAYRNLTAAVSGVPAIDIVSRAGGRFAASELPPLDDVPGVRGSVPLLFRTTFLRAKGKRSRVLTAGLDFAEVSRFYDFQLTEGAIPTEPDQVLVDAGFAEALSLAIGDRCTLFGRRGPRSVRISGFVAPQSLQDLAEGATVFLPLATAQDIYELEGQVDRSRVLLVSEEDRASVEKIAAERTGPLMAQATIRTGGIAEETLRSLELALRFSTALALVMSIFVVLNTLRMNFHERRREFALLRALGGSQSQLSWILASEGITLGLFGGMVGIPAGLALAALLSKVLGSVLGYEGTFPWPSWTTILWSLLVGEAAVVAAIVWSKWGGNKVSPAEAMREFDASAAESLPWGLFVGALAAWIVAVAGLAAVRTRLVSDVWTIPFGLLMLVSYVATLPVLLPLVLRVGRFLVLRRSGLYALLTTGQLEQRPVRIGLTVGVLVVAISSGLGLGSAIHGQLRDIRDWYRRTMSGDYFLMSAGTSDPTGPDSKEIREQLSAVSGVEHLEAVRFVPGRVAGEGVVCIIRDFSEALPLPWSVSPAREAEIRTELSRGGVVISSILASRCHVRDGDEVLVEIQSRVHTFRVVEIVNDYNFGGMTLFASSGTVQSRFPLENPDLWIVKCSAGNDQRTGEILARAIPGLGLSLQSFSQVRAQLDQILNGVVGALWTLIAVGFAVSGFAVANTVAMHVIEQTRELGLLRVIGMPARQVRRLILVQSLLLGIAGALLGTAAGVTTAWIIHWCGEPLTGRSLPLEIPFTLLAGNALGGVAITLLAGLIPAWRAGRLEIGKAVSYE